MNTSLPISLSHNSLIRSVDGAHRRVHVGTCRGYALSYKGDPEASHQQSLARGEDTAWSSQEAGVLHNGSAEQKAMERAKFDADMASATVINPGMLVEIEGEVFTCRVMGWHYADPVVFVRVKT